MPRTFVDPWKVFTYHFALHGEKSTFLVWLLQFASHDGPNNPFFCVLYHFLELRDAALSYLLSRVPDDSGT